MGNYTIDFIGLINFFREEQQPPQPNQRLALLPDGSHDTKGIEKHFASFVISAGDVVDEKTAWWPEENDLVLIGILGVRKFPIKEPSFISISGIDVSNGAGGLDTSKHDGKLPRLQDQDPLFRIVPDKADTIVQLPIRSGTLEARMFVNNAMVTRLKVANHSGDVTITARPKDATRPTRTLTVKNGAEIVMANMSNTFGPAPSQPDKKHFHLYCKLDKDRRDQLFEPTQLAKVGKLKSKNPFILKFQLEQFIQFPGEQCSNTGCC